MPWNFLLIFTFFAFFPCTLSPTESRSQTRAQICRGSAMQKPSTSLSPCHGWREADESDLPALRRQAYWTWQHHLCAGRWITWAETVGFAPTCWATFFIANTGCSNNNHISILGHCLQVQTNNSGRVEICYQPAFSQHSQKQFTETTLLERIRMDNCSKYIKKMLLAARDFTFSKRKITIWHFL